jgi:tetratricopeptide (TPR) repeat protein
MTDAEASKARNLPSRAFSMALALGCLAALILRWAILDEFVRENPVAEEPWTDGRTYWAWAARLATGQWIGDTPFLSAPLYPYLLGVIRAVGGELGAVYAVQLVLHVATLALIGLAARVRFGNAAGLLAALLFLTLTEPAVSSTRLLGNTLQLFLVALLWWRWAVQAARGSVSLLRVVEVGALIGLLTLTLPPALLLIVAYGVWLWRRGRSSGRRLKMTLAGVGTALACMAPATVHNLAVSGEFIPVSANGGINLYIGNGPGAKGVFTFVEGIRPDRDLMFEDAAKRYEREMGRRGGWNEVDGFYRNRALRHCVAHPVETLALLATKVYWFATARNYDDQMPVYMERRHGLADRLVLAPVDTPWLMGAALAGLIALWRKRALVTFEWLLPALPLLVVLMFFYTPRYRLPAVPLLCGLGAYALVHFRHLGYPRVLAVALILLPLPLYLINRQTGFDFEHLMHDKYRTFLADAYVRGAQRELETGDVAEAGRRLESALAVQPDSAFARREVGLIALRRGDLDVASAELAQVPIAGNDDAIAHGHLYNALIAAERFRDAARVLKTIMSARPEDVQSRLSYAWLLATCPDDGVRDGAAAVRHARDAIRLAGSARPEVFDVLAAAQAETGQFSAAITSAELAAQAARQLGDQSLMIEMNERADLYRNGRPLRAHQRAFHLPPLLPLKP